MEPISERLTVLAIFLMFRTHGLILFPSPRVDCKNDAHSQISCIDVENLTHTASATQRTGSPLLAILDSLQEARYTQNVGWTSGGPCR